MAQLCQIGTIMGGDRSSMTAAERAIASLSEAQSSEPELDPDARRLMTFNGWWNALANNLRNIRTGGNRDELGWARAELQNLKLAAEHWGKILDHQQSEEQTAAVMELNEQLGRKDASASTSFDPGYEPAQSTDSGAN